MGVTSWVLGLILAAVFGLTGATKLLDLDRMREHFRYSKGQYRLIGLSEIAGVAGVIIGLVSTKLEWVAIAAASGLATLMMGALIKHANVDDPGKQIVPAMIMMVVAVAFIIVISLR